MDALLILLVVGFWLALTAFVALKGPKILLMDGATPRSTRVLRIVLLVTMLLIPTADELWGRYRVKLLCAAEGGVKVFKTMQGVDGVRMEYASAEDVKETGYRFIEATKSGGVFERERIEGPARYSVGPDGQVRVERRIVPQARYAFIRKDVRFADHIWGPQQSIIDLETNEVLAKDTYLAFGGGWAFRPLHEAYGTTSAGCRTSLMPPRQFLLSVLKPVS